MCAYLSILINIQGYIYICIEHLWFCMHLCVSVSVSVCFCVSESTIHLLWDLQRDPILLEIFFIDFKLHSNLVLQSSSYVSPCLSSVTLVQDFCCFAMSVMQNVSSCLSLVFFVRMHTANSDVWDNAYNMHSAHLL